MMTSKSGEHTLCSLLFKTTPNYNTNLPTLLSLINTTKDKTIIVAPEVCLTGFDYDNIDAVISFAEEANNALKIASHNKTVILTIIEQKEGKLYNMAKIFHNGELVHERAKAKLFRLGGEHKEFEEGKSKEIEIVEIEGVSYALLICFELRFKELWKQIEGADVVLVPTRWGKPRKRHLEILSSALAVMNQCYVIVSNSSDIEMASSSAIISPTGEVIIDDKQEAIEGTIDFREIKKMRRYIVMD